ncbi:MAG TPA: aspartate-semialdehyde dehydrogenase, partial [Terrimicrobiaceae bacterium]
MLHVMERRNFPTMSVKLLASARSAGKTFKFRGQELVVKTLGVNSFEDVDLAFFSAGSAISLEYAPIAVQSGAIVIDNSSAHRMQEEVPLIVPEINGKDIASHRGIIANPNCTTAITLMALYPLHRKFRVKRIFASSYQAVSGAGALAMEELKLQSKAVISGRAIEREVFPHQIAFNVIPQVDSFLDSGYTREEMKLQNESRRIMHLPSFKASVTCVRVPVFRAHSVAVSAEFQERVTLVEAREAIVGFRGIELRDDPTDNVYPMPLEYAGEDVCAVGRLRIDSALENG